MKQSAINNQPSAFSTQHPAPGTTNSGLRTQDSGPNCIPISDCLVNVSVRCLTCRWLQPRNRYLGDPMLNCRMGHFNIGSLPRALDPSLLETPTPEMMRIAAECDDYQSNAA